MILLMSFQEILSEYAIALLSLIVALVTIIATLISTLISKRYEYKTSVLNAVLSAAFNEYKMKAEAELALAKSENRKPNVQSFTEFIIFYTKMCDVLTSDKLSPQKIESALRDNKQIIDSYYSLRDQYRPDYHKAAKAEPQKVK